MYNSKHRNMFKTILVTRISIKNLSKNYNCRVKQRGIILVKMNFMVGTFLISRSKVVCSVSGGSKNRRI